MPVETGEPLSSPLPRWSCANTRLVVVSPEVLDVFPDGAAVNEALQALAPLLRHR